MGTGLKQLGVVDPAKLGISWADLGDLTNKHGEEVLKVLEDALASGLSKDVILEALNLGGSILVEVLSSLKSQKKLLSVTAVVQGQEVDSFNTDPQSQLIQVLLQKLMAMLPDLLSSLLTPANVQALISFLFSQLAKK